MPELNWNDWANGWSAAFPKNSMWGAIRSGENDPETGEPLKRFNDKPSTASMSPELADIANEHRFIAPAVSDTPTEEHCFCGWHGASWGKHYQGKLADFAGDHNAPVEDESDDVADDKPKPAPKKAPALKVVEDK